MVASFGKKVFQIRSNCMNEKLITSIVSKSLHNQSFIKFKCLEIFFRYFARTQESKKGNFFFYQNVITLMIVSKNQMLSPQMSVTINCVAFITLFFSLHHFLLHNLNSVHNRCWSVAMIERLFSVVRKWTGKKWYEPKQLKVLSLELDCGLKTNVSRQIKRSKLFYCWCNEIHNENRTATFSSVQFTSRWLFPFYHQSIFTT